MHFSDSSLLKEVFVILTDISIGVSYFIFTSTPIQTDENDNIVLKSVLVNIVP
ncbi:MAG: hypothetical protein K2X86_02895 [Cytophagaceae bacterium]|nr:hypothetical protein [Cytophagaceae bacterium]